VRFVLFVLVVALVEQHEVPSRGGILGP